MNKSPRPYRIVLTGGGTAGHVTPHIALLPLMQKRSWKIFYLGSKGMEKALMSAYEVSYKTIQVGKLRRYFSFENFFDIFRLFIGVLQSIFILIKIKPHVIFSKGGFVSVPVAVAAKLLSIPLITHESDLSVGLANRLIGRLASKIAYTFPPTARFLPAQKACLTGVPIRQELLNGCKEKARVLCGFVKADVKPTLLIMGGSLGSKNINESVETHFEQIIVHFRIVHLTGKGKTLSLEHRDYASFEFVQSSLCHLYALADIVMGRAGSNTIFELIALQKPTLLIPLVVGSRGDQIENASYCKEEKLMALLWEKQLPLQGQLVNNLIELWKNRSQYKENQKKFYHRYLKDSQSKLISLLSHVS